jgi:intracellular multiplication protein IcmK
MNWGMRMKLDAIVLGALMVVGPPFYGHAQQAASYIPNGMDKSTRENGGSSGAEAAIPVTAGMIRDLGRRIGENNRAKEEMMTQIASPNSRSIVVALAAGSTVPIIHIVKGYPTAVSFFDKTGAPWPIEWDTNSNPANGSGGNTCNANSGAGGNGPSVGFNICAPVTGSNVLQISSASLQPRGGLVVNLKGAPKPLSFLLIAGGSAYDADLSVRVADRGPNAKTMMGPPSAPDTSSPYLTAMLDGAPPAEAIPLAVSGVSPDLLRAWRVGDKLVLRTTYTLVSPEWTASENGEGGMTVYSLPDTPIVLLSAEGHTVSAQLSEN